MQLRKTRTAFVLSAVVLLQFTGTVKEARADAIVVTKAMKASTIAEIFVTRDSIHVQLEIGVDDLIGFRNLMPDPIYERMGFEPEAYPQRLRRFLKEDWTITTGRGLRLEGRVQSLQVRQRVSRDEVTGEPLPATGEQNEPIVYAVLVYGLSGRPGTLTFKPPFREDGRFAGANVGFVVYHQGLPVTDFRYLSAEETLELDWEDPWYSRFRNRNLRRRFDAPISGFLYVENYEVRKEIIARPKDLQQWIDLGLAGKDTIRVAEQEELKLRVAEYLQRTSPVTIDGHSPEPVLDRVNFVNRTLRRTGIIDPPVDLPVISATLGAIYVYPVDSLPEEVSMSWELFSDRIQRVPASATDEAGGLPYVLTPGDSILTWQNFLTNPTVTKLVAISAPGGGLAIPVVSALCTAALVGILISGYRRGRLRTRRTAVVVIVLIVTVAAASPFARVAVPVPGFTGMSQEQTEEVVLGLLTNVYRAFDYRDESIIYDTLARSASGPLLTRIYLETRQALELQSQGGARVKVKDVDLSSVKSYPVEGTKGFTAECTWTVSGSVGHWGHLHTRKNQYDAVVTIEAVDGVWKITMLELVEEKRIS
jgi:hypothetical protein